jgi:hypothetical protein
VLAFPGELLSPLPLARLAPLPVCLWRETRVVCPVISPHPLRTRRGKLHADQAHRDSLAADLMEPIRPQVDAYVFALLTQRPFAARDFHETRAGVCRLTALLTHELGETLPLAEAGRSRGGGLRCCTRRSVTDRSDVAHPDQWATARAEVRVRDESADDLLLTVITGATWRRPSSGPLGVLLLASG